MTATRTPASTVQSPSTTSWAALTVLMFGTFMFVLDFFIVNVALPSIQQGLRAGESAIEWVVAGYAISTAVLLVTGGRLGDQFGRRRVFALCITPLTTTVLSHADPATAGSVSGALSTAQQVGNSIGVAVTGLLFFGALNHGYGVAFERSVLQMGALLLVVAALTRLMPARTSGAR